jgi:hypothetical protein
MPPMTKAALQAALDMNGQIVALSDALHTERARTAAAEAQVAMLSAWIIEADAAFNVDNKPAETLDDCLGLVRMCHEGAAALTAQAALQEALAEALDPNTEWTQETWARLLAVRDGDTRPSNPAVTFPVIGNPNP